jgi:hypothetical protein
LREEIKDATHIWYVSAVRQARGWLFIFLISVHLDETLGINITVF